ncbi:hypothetical protein [Malacoplasma iowae]|uniref:Uncharacterized protein n=1 Tax=Malacoplasma iowae 695 TaxID=1048830 RepID=A0A6P1LCB7_MALIO|nr:hypothetical protein [Malacoplasma iowae]VEU62347.1 Uncharacterised protein [Mycoplasmopsis fermentans]EGZ31537.1 hypothetical protein GUU_01652 [Malacoplasma iowae 695]QHG89827.1 hypothetical protein EER00_02945 [Malacoplasma iowae 695]WPL35363.1 hypothetical protein QX180_03450 [Malacoplasma iowae]VEU72413.1 Uncharacterised protein [Malacoplasma iowae]
MIFYFIGGAFLTTISGAATIFGTINSFTEYQNLSNVYNFQNINSYSGVKGISFDDFLHNYNISNDKKAKFKTYTGLDLSEALGYKVKLNNVVTVTDFTNWSNEIRTKIPNYSLNFPDSKKFLDSVINISYVNANKTGFIVGATVCGIGVLALIGLVGFYFSSNHRLSFDKEVDKEGLFFRKTKKNSNEYSYKNHRNTNFDYDFTKANKTPTRQQPSYVNKLVNNENKFSSNLDKFEDDDKSFTLFGQSTKVSKNNNFNQKTKPIELPKTKPIDLSRTRPIQFSESQRQNTNIENKNPRVDARNSTNTIKIDFDKYKKENQNKK